MKYSLMLLITWYVTGKLNLTGSQAKSVCSEHKSGTGIILGILQSFLQAKDILFKYSPK